MIYFADEAGLAASIDAVPLLDEAECDALRANIHALRPHWIQRMPGLPMYTLGAAAYLDGPRGPDYYQSEAARNNPVLREHFSPLYRRLEDILSRHLQGPIAFPADKALPGFHIFLANQAFTVIGPSIHADLQYRLTDWSWAAKVSRPISFTAAVALPREGGGLNVWDLDVRDYQDLPPPEAARALRRANARYVAYRRGHIAVQSGHKMHQIAKATELLEDDERITLQGHGLLCDGVWQIYW
jgi:hypothetical protein